MNLLIPHGRSADKYLVQAAQEMGHRVHLMCNLQERSRLGGVGRECLPDVWVPLRTRFDLKLSHENYQRWYYEEIRDYVAEHDIDAILPCSSMDLIMDEVAQVNEEFNLLGVNTVQAAFFRDKTTYLPIMDEAGIRVPEIYEIVEPSDEPKNYDLPYPVIAKPGLGCGGYGIFIAKDEDALRWFFNHSDDENGFSERALFYQDRDFVGRPKSYLHFGFGGRYLIQEYIDGPCISLAGITIDGVPQLDLAYDIGISAPPTCAEINFGWPSIHPEVDIAAANLVASYQKCGIAFPDGAWMADAILRGGELWIVDFSVRMSSSGTKMMYHTCDDVSYAANVINAALGERWRLVGSSPTNATYYSFIPFPKGNITNIQYPAAGLLDEVVTPLRESGKVFEMRNDVQVADRGWVIATGYTRAMAQRVVNEYIDAVEYDLNATASTPSVERPWQVSLDNTEVVALDTFDTDRVIKFFGECNLDPNQWQGLEDDLWLYLDGVSGNLWGSFVDGELVATMGIRIASDAPYYVLHSLMTNQQHGHFNANTNGFGALFATVLPEMENRHYYRYYSHMKIHIYQRFTQLWTKQIPITRRYHYTVEEVVPAGNISKYPMFAGLMTPKSFNQPYVIRSGTLMQQYRTEEFQI